MKGFLRFFRDTTRLSGLVPSKPRIVLFSEGNNHWTFIRPVAEHLRNYAERYELVYVTQSPNDIGLKSVAAYMHTFCVGAGRLRDFALNRIIADVFITTSPDLGSFQVKRSSNCSHYAYVQHSLNSLHMAYREGAFNQFDSIFCGGAHHEREIEKLCRFFSLPMKKTYRMTYEPVRLLRKEVSKDEEMKKESFNTILIAPTWGDSSLIESGLAEALIRDLLDDRKEVVLRPHPETTKLRPETIKALERKFSDSDNFYLDTRLEQLETLKSSDLLITDWSGVAFDFALGLKRPVIFINTKPKIKNPNYWMIDETPIESSCRDYFGLVISTDDSIKGAIKGLAGKDHEPDLSFEQFFLNSSTDVLDEFICDNMP